MGEILYAVLFINQRHIIKCHKKARNGPSPSLLPAMPSIRSRHMRRRLMKDTFSPLRTMPPPIASAWPATQSRKGKKMRPVARARIDARPGRRKGLARNGFVTNISYLQL